jgi:hypothetical protein
MNSSIKMGLVKVALLSILLALSGMAAIASAADGATPIRFYGNATLNDEPATTGMVINAYIDDEFSATYTIVVDGKYYIDVRGNESNEGGLITFEICGVTADQTDTWHASTNAETRLLDLTAVDDEAPVVTNATATPSSIVANGDETSQLSVTVVDDSDIDFVTVDLSAIGGSAVQVMESGGGAIYSMDTNASMDTPPGTYYLYVNASDVFGNYDDTSVCIELEIVETTTYAKGDLDHNGQVADAVDVAMMLQASVGDITATSEYDLDGNGQNADAVVDVAMMLQASVGDITL